MARSSEKQRFDERRGRDIAPSLQILRRSNDAEEFVNLLPRVMLGEASAHNTSADGSSRPKQYLKSCPSVRTFVKRAWGQPPG